MAIYINGKLVAGGGGSSGGGTSGPGGSSGGGFVEMKTSIPAAERTVNTLYGLILKEYSGQEG